MPIIRNKTVDRRLSPADLFCNMSASKAFRIIETYKNIRTALLFTLSSGHDNTIVITSAEPNSGKSEDEREPGAFLCAERFADSAGGLRYAQSVAAEDL